MPVDDQGQWSYPADAVRRALTRRRIRRLVLYRIWAEQRHTVGRGHGQAVRGRAVSRRAARRSGDAHENAGARSGDHREWAVGLDDEISASRPDEAALAGVRWSDPAVLLLLRRGMCGFTHPG